MKKAIILLIVVSFINCLSACTINVYDDSTTTKSNKTTVSTTVANEIPMQTIMCGELSIQVPKDMKNVTRSDEIQEYGFDFAVENDQLFICGIRQDTEDLENGESLSVEDYAELLVNEYGLTNQAAYGEREGKNYYYLIFSMPLSNGINEYLCGVYKCDEAFWLIQMNCLTSYYDETQFFECLDSVTFSE